MTSTLPPRPTPRRTLHVPHSGRVFALLAIVGLVSALYQLPAHWHEWLPAALPFAAGMFVFGTVMVLAYGLERLPGVPRTWSDVKATAVPALGLGFKFGVGFVVLCIALSTLRGIPTTPWRAFTVGGAFVRIFVLAMMGGAAGGFVTGHWLRRRAGALARRMRRGTRQASPPATPPDAPPGGDFPPGHPTPALLPRPAGVTSGPASRTNRERTPAERP